MINASSISHPPLLAQAVERRLLHCDIYPSVSAFIRRICVAREHFREQFPTLHDTLEEKVHQ